MSGSSTVARSYLEDMQGRIQCCSNSFMLQLSSLGYQPCALAAQHSVELSTLSHL